MVQEKQGHVKGAFSRFDIGDIDLVWGDAGSGLCHIIQQRERQGGVDVPAFLSELSDVIENGEFVRINDEGRIEYYKDKKVAIITPELRGGHLTYLFTAYKTRKAPS